MKKYILFNLALLLIASCGHQSSRIAEEHVETQSPSDTNTAEMVKPENAPQLPAVWHNHRDNSEMVLIPAGEFIYGINKAVLDSFLTALSTPLLPVFESQLPSRVINLPSFYIDKFEITNSQYRRFVDATGHREPRFADNPLYNAPNQPVVGIGWNDAIAYAEWAGKRLPSEEEWEKAARGTDGRIFPWGNTPSAERYNGRQSGKMAPVVVGSYPGGTGPYGVMDMAGNVYEMTTGIWGDGAKAMRGGSFLNAGAYATTTFRWASEGEKNGAEYLGFRCVADTTIVVENAAKQTRN